MATVEHVIQVIGKCTSRVFNLTHLHFYNICLNVIKLANLAPQEWGVRDRIAPPPPWNVTHKFIYF